MARRLALWPASSIQRDADTRPAERFDARRRAHIDRAVAGSLAAHVRDELAGCDLTRPQDLPCLRACALESLRLWPTAPGVLSATARTQRPDVGPAEQARQPPAAARNPQHYRLRFTVRTR